MYYIYEHWRPDTQSLFYIGKGFGRRAYRMSYRSKWHARIQEKLLSLGMAVEVRIVASGLSAEEACMREVEYIKIARERGVDLVNMTNGGDGIAGFKHSISTRERMKISALKANTEEVKKKKSIARTGKKLSESHRQKISLLNIGNKRASGKRSKEFCEHMSRVLKGRKLTAAQIEQRRASMLLVWQRRKLQAGM